MTGSVEEQFIGSEVNCACIVHREKYLGLVEREYHAIEKEIMEEELNIGNIDQRVCCTSQECHSSGSR